MLLVLAATWLVLQLVRRRQPHRMRTRMRIDTPPLACARPSSPSSVLLPSLPQTTATPILTTPAPRVLAILINPRLARPCIIPIPTCLPRPRAHRAAPSLPLYHLPLVSSHHHLRRARRVAFNTILRSTRRTSSINTKLLPRCRRCTRRLDTIRPRRPTSITAVTVNPHREASMTRRPTPPRSVEFLFPTRLRLPPPGTTPTPTPTRPRLALPR